MEATRTADTIRAEIAEWDEERREDGCLTPAAARRIRNLKIELMKHEVRG